MSSQSNSNDNSFFIRTFGCKVNQYESQAIREMLVRAGYSESASKESAGLYIVNTCTVTSQADKEARYVINLLHRTNPEARIVVTGCMASRDEDKLSSLPGVTDIIRNEDKPVLTRLLQTNGERRLPAEAISPINSRMAKAGTTNDEPGGFSITGFKDHSKAFLKIQDGCENFCSYCRVPYVRGRFRSKPLGSIIEETRALVKNGFHEIVLTGICLGSWGQDISPSYTGRPFGSRPPGLADILNAIDSIPGDFRVRLSSIEPKYVTDELLGTIARNKRVCRHLHMPLQSGDDAILEKMNRPYTSSGYMDIIRKAHRKIPEVAITTDVIVGFPGETDSHFRNTVNILKEIRPLRAHIFRFSRREGTAAYNMGSGPSPEAVERRYAQAEAVVLETSFIYRSAFIGKTVYALAESRRDRNTGSLCGYTDNYIKVSFDGPDSVMRKIVPVTITNVEPRSTKGIYNKSVEST